MGAAVRAAASGKRLFDPDLVRIAHGRDAADAAFATSVGVATLESTNVSAIDLSGATKSSDEIAVAVSIAEGHHVSS